jgi:hypothetical protein
VARQRAIQQTTVWTESLPQQLPQVDPAADAPAAKDAIYTRQEREGEVPEGVDTSDVSREKPEPIAQSGERRPKAKVKAKKKFPELAHEPGRKSRSGKSQTWALSEQEIPVETLPAGVINMLSDSVYTVVDSGKSAGRTLASKVLAGAKTKIPIVTVALVGIGSAGMAYGHAFKSLTFGKLL